ncbi:hypothetical protein ANN_00041 [Periplaneta americana]|uniref:Uncharacterized protein n=1 Tax=Periplaneta americana TaxID=6978 RepID=A0ABQ8TS17_PERAM|nr:hypothetical protein ANN_00041 [Periplaneta americana]
MAGLCEGGNEPPGSLKAMILNPSAESSSNGLSCGGVELALSWKYKHWPHRPSEHFQSSKNTHRSCLQSTNMGSLRLPVGLALLLIAIFVVCEVGGMPRDDENHGKGSGKNGKNNGHGGDHDDDDDDDKHDRGRGRGGGKHGDDDDHDDDDDDDDDDKKGKKGGKGRGRDDDDDDKKGKKGGKGGGRDDDDKKGKKGGKGRGSDDDDDDDKKGKKGGKGRGRDDDEDDDKEGKKGGKGRKGDHDKHGKGRKKDHGRPGRGHGRHSRGNKGGRRIRGQRVTWQYLWSYLKPLLIGNNDIKLNDGSSVSWKDIRNVLRPKKDARTPDQLSKTEVAIWEYIWESLSEEGFTFQIVHGEPYNGKSVSWEDLYMYLNFAGGSDQQQTTQTLTRKILIEILKASSGAGKPVTLNNGDTVEWGVILSAALDSLEGDDLEDLSAVYVAIWQYIFEVYKQKESEYPIKLAEGETHSGDQITWEDLWLSIQQEELDEKDRAVTWQIVYNILLLYKKGNDKVQLQTGKEVTWNYVLKIFRQLQGKDDDDYDEDELDVLDYVMTVIEPYGFTSIDNFDTVDSEAFWPYLLYLVQQAKTQKDLSPKLIWRIFTKSHQGDYLELGNGKIVSIQVIKSFIDNEYNKNPDEYTEDEKDIVAYINDFVFPETNTLTFILQIIQSRGDDSSQQQTQESIIDLLTNSYTIEFSKRPNIPWQLIYTQIYDKIQPNGDSSKSWDDVLSTIETEVSDAENEPTTPGTTDLPRDQQETVEEFQWILQNSDDVPSETIQYGGVTIPVIKIIALLNLPQDPETGRYDISNVTDDEIWNAIFTVYSEMEKSSSQGPPTSQNIEELTFDEFKDYINNPDYVENGYLLLENVKIAILLIIERTTTDLTEKDQEAVDSVVNIVENSDDVEDDTVEYKDYSIPITLILNKLGASKDPDTGRYDIKKFTAKEIRNALVAVYSEMEESTTEGLSTSEDIRVLTFDEFKDDINNPNYDPSTEKYDTSNLTEEEWLAAINELYEEIVSTTSTTERTTTELTEEDQEAVDSVVNIVENSDDVEDDTVEYKGYPVSIKSIILYLKLIKNTNTGRYDITNITDEEIWNAIFAVYSEIEKSSTEMPTTSEGLTFEKFKIIINNPDYVEYGNIMYNDVKIPISGLVEELGLQKDPSTGEYDTSNLTEDEWTAAILKLYDEIVNISTTTVGSTTELTPEDREAVDSVVNIIQNSDDVQNDTVVYKGYPIPIILILYKLGVVKNPDTGRYDISKIKEDEIWKALFEIFLTLKQSTTEMPTTPEGLTFEKFKVIINNPDYVEYGNIMYNDVKIPISGLVEELGLQKDPSTGEYDTSNLTEDEWTAAILKLYDEIVNISTTTVGSTTELTPEDREAVDSVVNIIQNSDDVQNDTVVYKGYPIPIILILYKLGVVKDPDTGRYDISKIKEDEIWKALFEIFLTLKQSTTEMPTTPEGLTFEKFKVIINNPDYVEYGNIMYNDVKIPISGLVEELGLQKDPSTGEYDTSNLTEDEWTAAILKLYDEIVNMSTTTVGSPTELTQEDREAVDSVVNIIQNSDDVQNDTVVYKGYSIPIILILYKLGVVKDPDTGRYDISKVPENEIWKALLEIYLTLKQSTTEKAFSTTLTTTTDISEEEVVSLKSDLTTLKEEGINSTDDVVFKGLKIPKQFILTALSLQNIMLQDVTFEEFYKVILLYIERAQVTPSPDEEPVPKGLTKEQFEAIQYILYYLKINNVGDDTSVVFDGQEIPLLYILDLLKLVNITTSELSGKVLSDIILVYINNLYNPSANTDGLDSKTTSVLKSVLAFLKQQGSKAAGEIIFNGRNISLHYLVEILKLQGIDIQKATVEDLWRIIQLLIVFQSDVSPANVKQVTLNFFLQILRTSHNIDTETFIYNGYKIYVNKLISILNLQKDSSGKYIIDNLTVDEFWSALQMYVKSEESSTTEMQPNEEDEVIYNDFISILQQSDDVESQVLIVNGTRIPLLVIINALNLKKDSSTGRYNFAGITVQQLIKVINLYITSGARTSSVRVTSDLAQQQQALYEEFLKLIEDPDKAARTYLIVNDQRVPLLNVIAALGIEKDSKTGLYDTSKLTKEQVWTVLIQYVTTVKQ